MIDPSMVEVGPSLGQRKLVKFSHRQAKLDAEGVGFCDSLRT